MKKLLIGGSLGVFALFAFCAMPVSADTAACKPTGFRGLTAALINPEGATGDIDATGCNIGVYFSESGKIDNANIFGANYFGVVVNGGNDDVEVDIIDSKIHNIGEVPFNGAQHGNAVYYYGIGTAGNVTGTIKGNIITEYQKGGVIVNGEKSNVTVENNYISTVDLSYALATNSVQFGWGAKGLVQHNNIGGNQWCGSSDYVATAILLYDADSVTIKQNNIRGNSDVGIYAMAKNSVIDNNKVFDEGSDCNFNHYDYGIGNYGENNEVTNNKVKGFDTSYENVFGGKNKSISGLQPVNDWF